MRKYSCVLMWQQKQRGETSFLCLLISLTLGGNRKRKALGKCVFQSHVFSSFHGCTGSVRNSRASNSSLVWKVLKRELNYLRPFFLKGRRVMKSLRAKKPTQVSTWGTKSDRCRHALKPWRQWMTALGQENGGMGHKVRKRKRANHCRHRHLALSSS